MLKKLFYLLSKSEKKKFYLLLFLILIMAFFDVLGVSSIAPFIALLTNPELVQSNEILIKLYDLSLLIGISNQTQFMFLFGVIVFFLIIISLIFRAITIYALTRFSLMQEYNTGKRLVEGYLRQNYSWFLNRNSSELGKSILSEVQQVIDLAFIPMLHLITSSVVAIALLALLIHNNPSLAITIGLILSLTYIIIFYLFKSFLSKIGIERLRSNEKRFEIVSEAFGASKEIKLGNLENVYITRFSKYAQIFSKNKSLAVIISILPRYLIEAMAFSGMIVIVLFLLLNGGSFVNILPTIALYVFAAYRLMPVLQQIYSSLSKLRFSKPAVDSLYYDVKKLDDFNNDKKVSVFENSIQFNKSIKLTNISFNYPHSDKKALTNINLSIEAFSKVGIVGSTGSGKTTLVDVILGLLNYDNGNFVIDELNLTKKNKRSWQKIIGYVPQQIYLSDTSIARNIAFGLAKDDINFNKIKEVSKIASLHDFVAKLPNGYNTLIGERGVRLSGGERQRIGIARALYSNPKLIIFDEATSALDNLTEKAVLESIDSLKSKVTIIMVAHRLATVKNCDIVFMLKNGEIISSGSYEELLKSNREFQKMTGLK
jgi:ATP-binding cassette, subfamily B, bacterial PglK